ncbi:outer membrane lipoprotein Blc-like [Diadema antillarum]|uniref:outer membrane lipoprotein Blc-like n=1 Tax=Diadema antillarum TaxID=105358 RepID=UPI003A89D60A
MATTMAQVFCFLTLCLLASGNAIHTVSRLIPEQYVGRWYQVLTNSYSDLFTGRDAKPDCGTADYTLVNETHVTVYNANYRLDEGYTDGIGGYAYIPDPEIPGRLKVVLDGVPTEGDYWVFKLGPTVEAKYQYSLVTGGQEANQLYVLSRDPAQYYQLYDFEVREYLALHGFTGQLKAPYEVPHPAECVYPPSPEE